MQVFGAIINNTTISRDGIPNAERYGGGGMSDAPSLMRPHKSLKR